MELVKAVMIALFSRLIGEEIIAWTPRICSALIKLSLCGLPRIHRKRFSEEWQSHLHETPGNLAKILTAISFTRAALIIRFSDNESMRRRRWITVAETYVQLQKRALSAIERIQTVADLEPFADVQAEILHLSNFGRRLAQQTQYFPDFTEMVNELAAEPMPLWYRVARWCLLRKLQAVFDDLSKQADQLDTFSAALERTLAVVATVSDSEKDE